MMESRMNLLVRQYWQSNEFTILELAQRLLMVGSKSKLFANLYI